MLETVVLLNIFWDLWYFFQDSSINKMLKEQWLFKLEMLCYNMHYDSKVCGQSIIIFKKLILLFSKIVLKWIKRDRKDLYC